MEAARSPKRKCARPARGEKKKREKGASHLSTPRAKGKSMTEVT